MRAAGPTVVMAIAALATLGACNRTHGAAKVAIPAADAPAAPAGPQMAAGLWRQRVSAGQGDATGVSVTRYCLDAGAAGALASFNQQLSGRCAERQMALSSDGAWHFRTACDSAAGKVVTAGTMRGDFASHYVVQAAQQVGGQAAHVMADVKRLGDCPSDMKPGDVILPGGARGRLSELPAGA